MNLSQHALTVPATAAHTFYALNIYTGAKYKCILRSETKWYYTVEVTGILSGGRVAVRRFHKATMCIDELCLYIRNVKEETTARIDAVKADRAADDEQEILNVLTPSPTMTQALKETAAIESTHTDPGGPIAHDAPHFCPACEGYAKADEMTASAWVTMLICIDCATAEEDALSSTLTGIDCSIKIDMRPESDIIEAVLEMNYIGGHLPGYHFTPTLKELPRNLFAYQPNNGREGSPNAIINSLGYYIVNLRRGFDTRALYDCLGHYIIHGDYDVINAYLIDLQAGV